METKNSDPKSPDRTISLLLVDDDRELGELMTAYLAGRECRLTVAADARRGLAKALEGGFDLVLLDVMMPGIDGFEVLRQLRRRSDVPVIMLTARTAQADRVAGLNLGADDYLPKPFGPEELLARIRAVLRRVGKVPPARPGPMEAGGVRLDPGTRDAWRHGRRLELTSLEFDILDCLVRSAGRAVSREELVAVLYQREPGPFERSIDVHVSHLRKKLEQDGPSLIRTVRGVGYQFGDSREES